jgi:glycosyltransferase involved in cell wall biosynthesis
MRVVHVSKIAGIAGAESHLLTLLPGLASRGIEVSMLVLENPARPADAFCTAMAALGVPVQRIALRWHLDPGAVGRTARCLRALNPDIVHTHLIHGDLYGQLAAGQAGVRHTISSRHNDNPFRRNPILKAANRLAMRRAAHVVAISEALAHFVQSVEGIDASRIVTIRYGLEPRAFPPEARSDARQQLGLDGHSPVVGFFGRLIHQKGVDVLLDAFQQVWQRSPSVRLVIVGDGNRRASLEHQAHTLGLDEAVTFTGWVNEAHRLMPACEVVVMPSRWEGFGLVALEAMSAARPLIASRVSALPEIVADGQTGILVPPEDPSALADAIQSLLSDPERALSMGQAGYDRLCACFSAGKMVQDTLSVYQDIAGALPGG